MIYTLTFNPAIDYVISIDELKHGEVNRSSGDTYRYGGKGINVSSVLTELGVENTALGFVGGFTGEALENGLNERGIKTDFVHLDDGITRINVKIKTGEETDINGQGPDIPEEKMQELTEKLQKLKKGDYLVISGSVPDSLPVDIYEQVLETLEGRGIEYVIDTRANLLTGVLKYRPFFIKPNRKELEEMAGFRIEHDEDVVRGARQLQNQGARNVIVSLGKEGAYMLCETGETLRMNSVPLKERCSVGAGDSLVAGFLAGYISGGNFRYALKQGVAAGAATACTGALATADSIKEKMNIMKDY